MPRGTREINARLERLRWAREEQEKELYQKMVDEADRLLESVDIGNTGVSVVETVLKRREMVAGRRRR